MFPNIFRDFLILGFYMFVTTFFTFENTLSMDTPLTLTIAPATPDIIPGPGGVVGTKLTFSDLVTSAVYPTSP